MSVLFWLSFVVCLSYHVSGVCVNNNNGFRIEWFDWLALLLQLQSIITAHNWWLPKTGSITSWTTNVFSSIVTDLVLIYETATSSVSVVRWLTLHSWILNHDCNLTDFSFTTEWLTNQLRVLLYLGANRTENTTFSSSRYSVFIHCCINVS
jgi:hypothetical protein